MPPPPYIAPVFQNSPAGYFGKTVSNRAWHLKGFMGLIKEFRELFPISPFGSSLKSGLWTLFNVMHFLYKSLNKYGRGEQNG